MVMACLSISPYASTAWAGTPASNQIAASGLALQAGIDVESTSLADLYRGETIYFVTRLNRGSSLAGADHELEYRWYAGDRLELQFSGNQSLPNPPEVFWALVHPGHFGPGPHRAVLLIDGAVVDEHIFDVHLESRLPDKAVAVRPAPREPRASDQLERDTITGQARQWLQSGDTDSLDRAADRYRASRERTAAGYWKLAALYHVANDLHESDAGSPHWAQLDELCVRWLARRPESIAAVIMRAKLMLAQAWVARGTAPGKDVSSAGRAVFRERVESARQVLDSHASVARQDPEWYALRITVAMAQGAPAAQIFQRASDALDRQPLYYGIHFAAEKALEPRWGGSEAWIVRYVTRALERSRPIEGNQAYVRIYFNVAKNAQRPIDELNLTGAKLPRMVESYNEVLRAFPDPHNREVARALMCLGGDSAHYRDLGHRGDDAVPAVASWDSPEWRQHCDQLAFEGIAQPAALTERVGTLVSFLKGFGEAFWGTIGAAALVLWLGLELLFRIGLRKSTEPRPSAIDPFDPARYPRYYYVLGGRAVLSNHWAVRMAVMGIAAAWALSTVPWPEPAFDGAAFGLCVAVSLVGLFMILRRVSSRVLLTSDAIEVRSLWNHRRLARDAIRARSPFSATAHSVVLYPSTGTRLPLVIPLVNNADDEFWQWFAPLAVLEQPLRVA
jgi:hypothetical protein